MENLEQQTIETVKKVAPAVVSIVITKMMPAVRQISLTPQFNPLEHFALPLPEEPLLNACVGELSVAHNMGLRQFDESPYATPAATGGWVRWGRLRQRARAWIADYGVKTQGERAAIRTLSGGNVQRAVLARELAGEAALLLVSNPVFGLDFAAVAEIHGRLMAARNRGAAVLLVSEDLDELLLLADRIVVMSEGRIVHDVPAHLADRRELGAFMGGKAHGAHSPAGAALSSPVALTPEAA